MPDTSGNNKTNKTHRNNKKNKKRLAELAAYTKKKKVPKVTTKKGTIVDPTAERLKQLRKSNSLVAVAGGISDTIKAYKNRNKT